MAQRQSFDYMLLTSHLHNHIMFMVTIIRQPHRYTLHKPLKLWRLFQ
ncbi:hypothetical protein THOG05_220030 [Vibrio rotiferianus]|nr:hypothetical protein THOG05_220030 [Vibrio rotiferianus]CAH1575759.1 hypothetical protein THOG10_240016 [Vibrio rotiferianus]CAH1577837.1 hypothetical protein THOB06_240017 [Vibrio rotiferianus]CAH1583158.1 hypothetical protein THOE12_70053 [Vibrio rotiferianus]